MNGQKKGVADARLDSGALGGCSVPQSSNVSCQENLRNTVTQTANTKYHMMNRAFSSGQRRGFEMYTHRPAHSLSADGPDSVPSRQPETSQYLHPTKGFHAAELPRRRCIQIFFLIVNLFFERERQFADSHNKSEGNICQINCF